MASLTIDDNIHKCKMYIYVRDVAKRHETIVEGRGMMPVRQEVRRYGGLANIGQEDRLGPSAPRRGSRPRLLRSPKRRAVPVHTRINV